MICDGILIVDKPKGMTSHDVVNIIRKIFHTKKIGHTGTLDPDATGVLVLGINQGTKLIQYLVSDDKEYEAVLSFGADTDTQDATGEIITEKPLPRISREEFGEVLLSFIGEQEQIPPMYSAIKVNGQPLYKYARKGEAVEKISSRCITVHRLNMIDFNNRQARIFVHCSKGTYIRTLCQDIAHRCDSCGHMTELHRLRAGSFSIDRAHTIDEMRAAEDPYLLLIPMNEALELPFVEVKDAQAEDIANGERIDIQGVLFSGNAKAVYQDKLLAIGVIENQCFVPKRVFH